MLRTWTSILSAAKFVVSALALMFWIGSGVAQAQTPPPDTFKVNYFAGANGARPDQTVRITNPGTATSGAATSDLCANIYVFRRDQQLAECCSCLVTPDGLRTLSVDFDLANNPLTVGAIGEGVIKVVSSPVPAGGCTAASAGSSYRPIAALRAWGVHNQDVSGGLQGSGVVNAVTETVFSDATLSQAELNSLQSNCGFITQLSHGGLPPTFVTYSTSGSYNGGGNTITFGVGPDTLTLRFQGVTSSPSPPSNISLGDIITSVTGAGNTIPAGTTLTINIMQTSPTNGSGFVAGQLTGTISQNSATLNSQIVFTVTSATIFGVTYTITDNPLTLVPPAVNGGITTVQAQVVASAPPGICTCGRGD